MKVTIHLGMHTIHSNFNTPIVQVYLFLSFHFFLGDSIVSIGAMSQECGHCGALTWKDEPAGLCCAGGKVQLPPLNPLPELLHSLLTDDHPDSGHFLQNIRKYNACFQMTSFGARVINEPGFMPTFKVQGQVIIPTF